jgi:N-acetylneuraminic acid mutarotase
MVVGGAAGPSSYDAVASTAIYDPSTGHWSRMTDMLQARTYAMAVALADGSVLVAGGSRDGQPLDTAERYFPAAGTWVAAGRLNLPRTQGTLTLLGDGRVLAAGGGIEGAPGWSTTASAEIFDPTTSTWTLAAPMSVARGRHTATLLDDGEVLVAGGATTYYGDTGDVTSSAEIYDPQANAWRATAPMSEPRYVHAAGRLRDGRVLVAGGWYSPSNSDPSHKTAEIYDPVVDHWTATGPMTIGRAQYGLASLPDGRVLAVGGVDPSYGVQAGSELYDPTTGIWRATGGLAVAVEWAAVQTLPDGRVLIAGGGLDALASDVTSTCEVFTPPPR